MWAGSAKCAVFLMWASCAVRGFLHDGGMSNNSTVEDKRVVTIELPADVIAKLKERAKRNQRSFSGELRWVLITSAEEGE